MCDLTHGNEARVYTQTELRFVPVCCGVLRCVVVCYSVLQCGAVCSSVLQCGTENCSVLRRDSSTHTKRPVQNMELQCVAVCCSVL